MRSVRPGGLEFQRELLLLRPRHWLGCKKTEAECFEQVDCAGREASTVYSALNPDAKQLRELPVKLGDKCLGRAGKLLTKADLVAVLETSVSD